MQTALFRSVANELDGFEIFEPEREDSDGDVIRITVNPTGITFSTACLKVLREPEYVVVFFDYSGKRLMIKPAQKETPNRVRMCRNGTTKSSRKNKISTPSVRNEILKITGTNISKGSPIVYGHQVKVVQPTLIFDLGIVSLKYRRKNEPVPGNR